METSSAAAHDKSSKAEDNQPPPSTNGDADKVQDEYSRSRRSKFRFKSPKSKSRSKHEEDHHDDHHHHRHHHRHHHHHRSKRRKTNRDDDDRRSPSPYSLHHRSISPNSAFRESLFDALADDEGAAFWESVYGQPIHTYDIPSVPKGPNGELE